MRIVFLGSDAIALPLLDWLVGEGASNGRIVAVYTQPDRPVGRGQKVQPNAIKTWALAKGIPVFQPAKLTEESRLELASFAPGLGLVMAYGHILKDAFIATPRLGMINLHASLLPAYRGASPIQTAVASGEVETGVSLMRIVRELDAGPVADFERVEIRPRDTALEVEAGLASACVPLLARSLPLLAKGELVFREQDRALASFCRKLVKEDGTLDFAQPASLLAARINGLYPWPSCSFDFGGVAIKAGQAEAVPGQRSEQPGTVLSGDGKSLLVACGEGVLSLLRLQRPGGRMLPCAEYLRGHPIPEGSLLVSKPMTRLKS